MRINGLVAFVFISVLLVLPEVVFGQNNVTEQQIIDTSSNFHFAPLVDSTLTNVDILSVVTVNQSAEIEEAFDNYVTNNVDRKLTGYRVRIFFDNSQNARTKSEVVAKAFAAEYPSIKVYRSHVSPYFKVTVGNFRTKDDAQRFARSIMDRYPSVFLVREHIRYPDI